MLQTVLFATAALIAAPACPPAARPRPKAAEAGGEPTPARSSSPRAAARKTCSTCRSRSPRFRATSSPRRARSISPRLPKPSPTSRSKPAARTNSTLTAFIRGVGQQDPVSGFEQGVGIYLDDVYLNRPQAAVLDIYDVQRIEVLRGPQGTLYGRNTVGGAIKYVTRRLPNEAAPLCARRPMAAITRPTACFCASTPLGAGTCGSAARSPG